MDDDSQRKVYFYYGTSYVTYKTTILKMSGNDLLSAVGGGVGLFLGLSIFSLAEWIIDLGARYEWKRG